MTHSPRVTKRINLSVPDIVFEELSDRANKQGRSIANLATFLIEVKLNEIKEREQQQSEGES